MACMSVCFLAVGFRSSYLLLHLPWCYSLACNVSCAIGGLETLSWLRRGCGRAGFLFCWLDLERNGLVLPPCENAKWCPSTKETEHRCALAWHRNKMEKCGDANMMSKSDVLVGFKSWERLMEICDKCLWDSAIAWMARLGGRTLYMVMSRATVAPDPLPSDTFVVPAGWVKKSAGTLIQWGAWIGSIEVVWDTETLDVIPGRTGKSGIHGWGEWWINYLQARHGGNVWGLVPRSVG